ncbi:uncharacterized protein LOC122081322 isoform X2 [Macadamia integrifolia]|uniref:uncharacterized protein LOC122081322 isoform X2 n=1 Tax=Macadamia integrifolia TaxID=60698 RepID=UPI001C4F7C84|nr:uncharacterized protein LOC122081322 isoform X2 [Macadamia integrifolia]
MATVAGSEEKSELSSGNDQQKPWIGYAVQQAQIMQKTLEETVDSAIETAGSRLSEIRSTSSAHFQMTLDILQDMKSDYHAYEDVFIGKIKEGVVLAASHPMATCGVAAGLGFLTLKKPRLFLYHRTLRLFLSEESLVSRADAKVKELRQSLEQIKVESEKLEKRALEAEEEMRRGRTKLRQAGTQIQGVIRSAYKIEQQARGLKDILEELPRREASQFRSQKIN